MGRGGEDGVVQGEDKGSLGVRGMGRFFERASCVRYTSTYLVRCLLFSRRPCLNSAPGVFARRTSPCRALPAPTCRQKYYKAVR